MAGMKVPSFVRRARGQSIEEPEYVPTPFNALEILTEHDRVHFVECRGVAVEYIPLTIGEELEQEYLAKSNPLSPLYAMIAKAAICRISAGLHSASDYRQDGENILEAIERQINDEIPRPVQFELLNAIGRIRGTLIERVTEYFSKYREKDAFPNKETKPYPRGPSPLDPHVSSYLMISEKCPFGMMDIARMTKLQYAYMSMCQQESLVRQSNDHHSMRKK